MSQSSSQQVVPEFPGDVQIAQAIVEIDSAMKRIESGPLKKDAIVVLLRHSTGVPMSTIRQVLDGLTALKKTYLK